MARIIVPVLLALVTHLLPALASRRSTGVIPPQQLITSPQSCLSDIECPLDQYCKGPPTAQDPLVFSSGGTCAPRLPEGSNCTNVYAFQCEQGTFCGFLHDFNPSPTTCLRQRPQGATCDVTAVYSCRDDLVCELEPTCRPFTFGFEGDFCQHDRHCQQDAGFFCRANTNRCTAKKAPGAECAREPNNFECQGFCVGFSTGRFSKQGLCQRLQNAGERCNSDTQCRTSVLFHRIRSDDLLCNIPTGSTGICVMESDLIRELGAPCDPDADTCDARRGLSCGRVGSLFKCVQRATSQDGFPRFKHFCTPGSPLSSCPPDSRGNPRECRQALSPSKQPHGMFGCRTRPQVVPLGNPCSHREFAICGPDAVCAEPPGVQRPSRYSRPLRTCMKEVPIGAPCPDQFRFKCADGSLCVDGTCQPMDTLPTVPVTFTSIGGKCSELSCPPGTMCSVGRCRFPIQHAGLWQPCFDSAQFELLAITKRCEDDLQCARNYLGEGVRLCRPKRGIGGICENDDSCIGDLQCDRSFRGESFPRRCFDPSLSLNLGDSCNPYPRADEPRCVYEIEMDPSGNFFTNFFPLSCLPKNGSHICQRAVGLFQRCSTEENIACGTDDLICSTFNVCVPKSQA